MDKLIDIFYSFFMIYFFNRKMKKKTEPSIDGSDHVTHSSWMEMKTKENKKGEKKKKRHIHSHGNDLHGAARCIAVENRWFLVYGFLFGRAWFCVVVSGPPRWATGRTVSPTVYVLPNISSVYFPLHWGFVTMYTSHILPRLCCFTPTHCRGSGRYLRVCLWSPFSPGTCRRLLQVLRGAPKASSASPPSACGDGRNSPASAAHPGMQKRWAV